MNMLRAFLFALTLATTSQALATESPPSLSSRLRQALATFDGRVFFSTKERRALETKPTAPDIPPAQVTAPPPPRRRLDGILWRDGRIVALWFDGAAVDPAFEPSILITDGIPATTVSGRRRILSPGQSWPPLSRDSVP
jgi:hypothetical protein